MHFEKRYIVFGIVILCIIAIYYMLTRKRRCHLKVREGFEPTDVDTLIDKLNSEEIQQHPIVASEENVSPATLDKLHWKNQAHGGCVENSYANGVRGNVTGDEIDNFYRTNTDLVDKSYIKDNDKFMPVDETNGDIAGYSGMGTSKHSPEDLFKVDKLLPQEVHSDWFEVMPEPIKVKNRHLVNVTRPVGVNTIGTSKKNASYDLRGSPPCPKFVVSPFLNSSIEPDLNIKGLN